MIEATWAVVRAATCRAVSARMLSEVKAEMSVVDDTSGVPP